MDIIIRDVEEKDGQYKIYNKDGTGGHWYISKESAEIVGQIESLVMQKINLILDRQLKFIEQELFYGSDLNTDWRLGRKDAYIEMKKYIESNFSL